MDLNDLISSLSQSDIDNLKETASKLLGNAQQPKSENVSTDVTNAISTVGKLMNTNDDRYNLIMALKPMLSEERQKKADEAAKILKLISLIPILRDSGFLNGIL